MVTSDLAKTVAFFPEVLGWSVTEMEMGGETATMFANKGTPIAHVRTPQMDGEPTWWNNYLRVEDVDASAAAVTAAGGSVLVPGTDIPPGRFATVTTPSGAAFSLFREASEDAANVPVEEGNIHWVELHSKDLAKDLAFLKGALGIGSSEMAMPQGTYHILDPEGAMRGGALAGQHPDAPSMWLAWVAVDSVDEALGRVERHGGTVVAKAWDMPGVGRLAIGKDPAGVVFGVIVPAQA
jgi:hypothetical protein